MALRIARSVFAALAVVVALVPGGAAATQSADWLGQPQIIAPGVEFFRSTDASLAEPPGPSAVYLLKLDPAKVTLSSVHAGRQLIGLDTVEAIAAQHQAIAAVNAGFFNTRNGDPASVMKIAGEFVSDNTVPRGVIAIGAAQGKAAQTFVFDQLSAKQEIRYVAAGTTVTVPIDGVDTTRARGKLMLYTPMYHADTDTALNGTEIVASGSPLKIREVRPNMGHTPIPRDGVVLSYGGLDLPAPIAALTPGTPISIATRWKSVNGVPSSVFESARDIVNGAGLLRRAGQDVPDWKVESLSAEGFVDARHPRTLIGVDDRGFVWLVAVDGRQPGYALGMNFKELQALARRLTLRDALNLDGGGSTTMVVKQSIVNKPSDATGARAVSDALIVKPR
jgi:hypothetical protein